MAARTRHDPPSRPADGYLPLDQITGQDPSRHYVFANPNDEETGLQSYLARGYVVETHRPDGPRSRVSGQVAEGAEIRSRGQVLVSRPWDEVNADNAPRLEHVNYQERRLLKDGGVDKLRGQGWNTKVVSSTTTYEERA